MQWIAISGSWRNPSKQVEHDVRITVANIISTGDGIVTGGALGVDYFATAEALIYDPMASQIKIILPTPLNIFEEHFLKRAGEGVITHDQANTLLDQLKRVKAVNPEALTEMAGCERLV